VDLKKDNSEDSLLPTVGGMQFLSTRKRWGKLAFNDKQEK
jgi:hypothetical protein